MPDAVMPTPTDIPTIREADTATEAVEAALAMLPTYDERTDAIMEGIKVAPMADHVERFLCLSGWAIYRTDGAPRPIDASTRNTALDLAISTIIPRESYSPGSPTDVLATADRYARFLAGQPDPGESAATVAVPIEALRQVVGFARNLVDPSQQEAAALAALTGCLSEVGPDPDDPF